MKIALKVCCISSVEEMHVAVKHGASAIGLVGEMPSGPGVISLEKVKKICETAPAGISTFLLTNKTDKKVIIEELLFTKANTIQLVDKVDVGVYAYIRLHLSHIKIVQVIHVINEDDINKSKAIAPLVDAILLDSGDPMGELKIFGGTGTTHNWQISRDIVESVSVPVFLAGGINPANVLDAILTVKPYGIDICSGLRTYNKLDESKLISLINEIKNI